MRSMVLVRGLAAALAPLSVPGVLPYAFAAGILGWGGLYLLLARRFRPAPLIAVDVAMLCCACAWAPLITDRAAFLDGRTWLTVLVGFSVVAYQWQLGALPGLLTALAGAAGYLTAAALIAPGALAGFLPLVLWFLVQALLSRGLLAVLRRGAGGADHAAEQETAARTHAAVARAARADEHRYLATLHDTAAATLMMVGLGTVGGPQPWLCVQARADLRALTGTGPAPDGTVDLLAVLREAVGAQREAVRVLLASVPPAPIPVPAASAEAVRGGLLAAIGNVARHSGVGEATLSVRVDRAGIAVELRDAGSGFDPRLRPPGCRGVTGSIAHRMAEVGGRGTVHSWPGRGTLVTLWLPAHRVTVAPEPERPPALAGHLLIGLRQATLAVAACALVLFYLPVALLSLREYRSAPVELLALAGLAAVIVFGAVTRRPAAGVLPALGCAVAGATVIPPAELLQKVDWTYMLVGLVLVALLLDRRLPVVLGVLGLHTALTVGRVLLFAEPDRHTLVAVLCVLINTLGPHTAIAVAAAELRRVAGNAAGMLAAADRHRIGHAVREQARRGGRIRHTELARTALPLLRGLATGALDPGLPEVRRACAAEAARMRRRFAESDEVADPLVHELRACANVAERRGLAVHLVVSGRRVPVPQRVRRQFTEPVLAILEHAVTSVRITVLERDRLLTVSAVGDTGADWAPPPAPTSTAAEPGDVLVDHVCHGGSVWADMTWLAGDEDTTKRLREHCRSFGRRAPRIPVANLTARIAGTYERSA